MSNIPNVKIYKLNSNKLSVIIPINPEKPFYRIVEATILSIDLGSKTENVFFAKCATRSRIE